MWRFWREREASGCHHCFLWAVLILFLTTTFLICVINFLFAKFLGYTSRLFQMTNVSTAMLCCFSYNFITFDWSFMFGISLSISVCAAFSSLLTSFVVPYSFLKTAHEFIIGRQHNHMLCCLCGMKNRCALTNHQQIIEEVVWLVVIDYTVFFCV